MSPHTRTVAPRAHALPPTICYVAGSASLPVILQYCLIDAVVTPSHAGEGIRHVARAPEPRHELCATSVEQQRAWRVPRVEEGVVLAQCR